MSDLASGSKGSVFLQPNPSKKAIFQQAAWKDKSEFSSSSCLMFPGPSASTNQSASENDVLKLAQTLQNLKTQNSGFLQPQFDQGMQQNLLLEGLIAMQKQQAIQQFNSYGLNVSQLLLQMN